jgi:hypothetical protein
LCQVLSSACNKRQPEWNLIWSCCIVVIHLHQAMDARCSNCLMQGLRLSTPRALSEK